MSVLSTVLWSTNLSLFSHVVAAVTARELVQREEEKQELAGALDRAYTELQNIRKQLARERQDTERKQRQMNGEFVQLREQLEDRAKVRE